MQIDWTEKTPRMILTFAGADYPRENPDLEEVLTAADVDHVAEIFQTPLTGSYNWDYTLQDDRIKKLYDLGKQLNWDPEIDIDWDRPWPDEEDGAELISSVPRVHEASDREACADRPPGVGGSDTSPTWGSPVAPDKD